MVKYFLRFCILSWFFSGTATPSALAAECGALKLLTSIDIALDGSNKPLVPVTIGGIPKVLLLDTGGAVSTVKKTVLDEFNLTPHRGDVAIYNAYRDQLDQSVTIPTLIMGRVRGNSWRFMVEPIGFDYSDVRSVAGTLGPDIFRQFDVDLDFPAKKLNLFSPDHCAGKIRYWRTKVLAILPMRVMQSGHIYIRVTLDGESMNALVDTGAGGTVINATTARRRFGLNETSTDVEKVKSPAANQDDLFFHRFKLLAMEGISVTNPQVQLLPDLMKKAMPFNPGSLLTPEEPQGLPDLIIGQSILSKLHVYIAYKEGKLYLAEDDPQPSRVAPAVQ